MKKYFILFCFSLLCLSGCKHLASKEVESANILDKTTSISANKVSLNYSYNDIFMDLSDEDYSTIYGAIEQMEISTDHFLGKVIRINGNYSNQYIPKTGKTYHFISVKNPALSYAQGLEFVADEEILKTLDDWDPIEVTGRLEKYTEEDNGKINEYLHLVNVDINTDPPIYRVE